MSRKKLKYILILLIILLVISLISLILYMSNYRCGENAYYSYDKVNHIVTITGTGTVDLTKGWHYKVENMEDRGFSFGDYESVGELLFPAETEKIIIKEGITGIRNKCGNKYGTNCRYIVEGGTYENLKEIVLPNSITNLEEGCFSNQTHLETINIPDSIKIIPKDAFYNCDKLYNIEFPKSIRIIEENAFEKCATLSEVKLQNIRYIGRSAFQNCYNLKDLEINGDIPDILAYTFDGCFNLKNVKLTGNIKIIDHSAFRNCKYLDRDELYANVESPPSYKWDSKERQKDLEEIKALISNE